MRARRTVSWLTGISLLALVAPGPGNSELRYLDGAPPGFTGGFGESSCHACHFSEKENDGAGEVRLSGLPDAYLPGERYPVTLTLKRPDLQIAGFQIAVRFEKSGEQAGGLLADEGDSERVGGTTAAGVHYLYQSAVGARTDSPGTIGWTFIWTAPEAGGRVVFNAAANAADGDGSAEGDFVYTLERGVPARWIILPNRAPAPSRCSGRSWTWPALPFSRGLSLSKPARRHALNPPFPNPDPGPFGRLRTGFDKLSPRNYTPILPSRAAPSASRTRPVTLGRSPAG